MKSKLVVSIGLLVAISGVAVGSPDDDSSDNWFDDEEDLCNGMEVGDADTNVRIDGSSLTLEGTYCASTAGFSVTSEDITVSDGEIDASVSIESPSDDQSVAQVITPVDYSVETDLDDGDYSLVYNVMLDGDAVDSGEQEISIGDQEQESDSFFGDNWFDDDFFTGEDDSRDDSNETDETYQPAHFELDGMNAPDRVRSDQEFTATANLTNTGDETETQQVRLELLNEDGTVAQELGSSNQQREAGESGVVGFDTNLDVEPGNYTLSFKTEDDSVSHQLIVSEVGTVVSEAAYIEAAPEPGDFYYQAGTDDWVSYVNPRDEYKRDYASYQGEGSGKICVTLLNEEGDHIIGESVPDTEVKVPTGESLDWHPYANPMSVQFPLNDHYDRPFDSDQFGTTEDLPQGDGYMDSHCIEFHDVAEDATIEYGQAEITGTYADDIEVVGYIQRSNEAWDTDVDPIEDAESYEEAGGGWTMYPGGSHGQAVVVLQLNR